ncbi:hypothetical protein Tco_0299866 [Tanacetum coccineum]
MAWIGRNADIKDGDSVNLFGSIRHIQAIGYSILEFLGVGTTFKIFQNIYILYLEYGVLDFSGYGVLSLFPLLSLALDQASPPLSLAHIADADPEEDPKEDPEKDPADHTADEGDDDEPSEDDVDGEDEEEASEEEDDDEEKEEHLAPADSSTIPTVDPVPSAEDTEAFEADESAPTPPPPRSCRAGISVRLSPPMAASMETRIAEYAAAPTSPSPPPSPLTPPTYAEVPLGYKAAGIRAKAASPLLLPAPLSLLTQPATGCKEEVPKADVPPQKRLCLTTPTYRFKIGESSAAAVRQPGSSVAYGADYSFVDTVDASI